MKPTKAKTTENYTRTNVSVRPLVGCLCIGSESLEPSVRFAFVVVVVVVVA